MSGDMNDQTFELLMVELKNLKTGQDDLRREVQEFRTSLNGRVRKLENWRWYLMGGGAACLLLLGFLLK